MLKPEEPQIMPANDNRIAEKEQLKQVFWIETDVAGNETGKAYPIALGPDGQADLGKLPPEIRETLETFGSFDKLSDRRIFPKDGTHFLRSLLDNSNAYLRIRRAP